MGRKAIRYGAIGIVAILVGRSVLSISIALWKAAFPAPPPPPTIGFGMLPAIQFPESDSVPSTYALETPTTRLPVFPDRAKVFFVPTNQPNLLADQDAKAVAAAYSFLQEPRVISLTEYRWTKNQPLLTTFTLDILDYTFTYYTDFHSRPELLIGAQPPDEFEAVQRTKTFLSQGGLLPADVATSSGTVTYLTNLGGSLEPASVVNDADYAQVVLARRPIDDIYPIISANGQPGTITAILTGAISGTDSIVQAESTYREIDRLGAETYPLRPIRDAWELVQANQAYIVNPAGLERVAIRRVELHYYESPEEQAYLQPVYAFFGDEGFVALTSALSSQFIERNPN